MDQEKQFVFMGSLTKADSKTFHRYQFDVPEGTGNLHIDFTFQPLRATGRIHNNQINVSLNDPDGIRGLWCGVIHDRGIDVNELGSTPGFRTAPLQAGTWTVFVDTHRILPPDTVTYELTITLSEMTIGEAGTTYEDVRHVATQQAGWYRGDLHAHTIHSDGSWDVPELTEYMRQFGLDFVSLTDHNIVSGLAQHRNQTEPGFLAMGGMELSTFDGHMLALGGYHWYEWRLNIVDGMDIHRIMQQVIDRDEMLIIAHPMSPDEPFCSGCLWQFDDARPGVAMGVEVWNGAWHMFNQEGLKQYYAWLNLGHRLVATSGTDIHRPYPAGSNPRIGFNVIYAEALSEEAILAALRQGHSYISAGPELLLTAETTSGQKAMVGDWLPDEAKTLHITWHNAHAGDILRLIVDGEVHDQQNVDASGEHSWSLAVGQARWCNVELRDANGDMRALTNPIFFGAAWR